VVVADVAELVREHVAAFNALDVERVLRGLSAGIVWQTGADTFVGTEEVAGLLRSAGGLSPRLDVVDLLTDGDRAAVEMTERYWHEGREHQTRIAVFFWFDGELITRVKVFREGSADP
jgi:hypothetical protein